MAEQQLPPRGNTKTFACVTCTQRKVKCDKQQPCRSCTKSQLECHYYALPPPRRRKRMLENVNQALVKQLRTYENLLRNAGLPCDPSVELDNDAPLPNAEQGQSSSITPEERREVDSANLSDTPVERPVSVRPGQGLLVTEYGGQRYYESSFLGALAKDFKQEVTENVQTQSFSGSPSPWSGKSQRDMTDNFAVNVLAGNRVAVERHASPFPPAQMVSKYWSLFLGNVHPLTKIIHAPTMRSRIFEHESGTAASSPGMEALRYAIFACAVASQSEAECLALFSESQSSLLPRLQGSAQNALLSTSFGSVPDLDQLRAYILLITSMSETSEPSTLWILMGSAIRIAQTQGVHRDAGALGLSPFETEMRRRLWWYLLTLDGRLAELTGSKSGLPHVMDNAMPLNVNDSDLDPDMMEAPKELVGATEMTFCLLKYEITRLLHSFDPWTSKMEPRYVTHSGQQSLPDLEKLLEDKFLRFCDPIVGVQLLTTVVGRSTVCKFKQMAQLRIRPGVDASQASVSDAIQMRHRQLEIAMRNMEYDNLIHSNRTLRGFLWHVHFFFPWGAPIVILQILTSSPSWDENMQLAWNQIHDFFTHHPEFFNTQSALHLLVGRMTIKAWVARDHFLRSKGLLASVQPTFITDLETTQERFWAQRRADGPEHGPNGGLVGPGGVVPMLSDEPIPYPNGTVEEFGLFGLDFFDPNMLGMADWTNGYSL